MKVKHERAKSIFNASILSQPSQRHPPSHIILSKTKNLCFFLSLVVCERSVKNEVKRVKIEHGDFLCGVV
jgi:hypothetical protein